MRTPRKFRLPLDLIIVVPILISILLGICDLVWVKCTKFIINGFNCDGCNWLSHYCRCSFVDIPPTKKQKLAFGKEIQGQANNLENPIWLCWQLWRPDYIALIGVPEETLQSVLTLVKSFSCTDTDYVPDFLSNTSLFRFEIS